MSHTRPALKAVLLDLDGTLVDSIPDLADAANAMRKDLGLPALPLDLITSFVGKGADHLIRQTLLADSSSQTLDETRLVTARKAFVKQYTRYNGLRTTIYPGVLEGLKAFQQLNLRLAVVTNKPAVFTHDLLAKTKLDQYMDVVVSGDTCETRKPDPEPVLYACQNLGVAPAEALFIGDSMNDALAARDAGCPMLAVPYGYREGMTVDKLPVDGIVQTLVDAISWIRQHYS